MCAQKTLNPAATDARPFADHRLGLRLGLGLCLGVVVAGFLTWFMYMLIELSEQQIDEGARAHILDFVRLKRDESSDPKQRRIERPESEPPPPVPAAPTSDAADLSPLAVSQIPMGGGDVEIGGFGIGTEGEFLPIVKVAPIYPSSAASRGVEGECLVRYTVTPSGTTRDIQIVDERCTDRAFRRPSLEAAAKFKYKPRIIAGEAVEVEGVHNLFTYTLDDK